MPADDAAGVLLSPAETRRLTDFATLVLNADSRGLTSGEQALNRFAATAERTENRTGKALDHVGKSANEVGKASIYASQQLRLQAMQLSQVAQQASATGNILQAIAIQLPDLALGFGPIGIAAGAAAGAALAYFSTILDSQPEASAALKEQEELITRVADAWGEAVPALQDYVDQLKRAKETSDLLAATDALAGQSWDMARGEVEDLNINLAALVQDLQAAGAETETILGLQDAWARVSKAVAEGRTDASAMKDVQDSLAQAIEETGIPALTAFGSAFNSLAQTINGASRQANAFKDGAIQALTVTQTPLGTLSSMWAEGGKFYTEEQVTPSNVPVPTSRGTPELSGFPWESIGTKSRSGGGRKSEADYYNDIVDAANRRIETLRTERDAIGLTEEASDRLRFQTDLFNDAQQRGIKLSDDQKAKLTGLASEMASLAEETRLAGVRFDFFNDLNADFQDGIVDSIVEGENFIDVIESIGKSLAKAALQAALFGSGPLGNGQSTGTGGLLGGLVGSLFSFDGGGSTGSGSRTGGLDGKGGFMALLHPQETVIDHTKGNTISGSTGQISIDARTTIQASGNAQADAEMRAWAAKRDAELPGRVVEIVRDAQKRRAI